MFISFFFNDTSTSEIYTLSLHDALPICRPTSSARAAGSCLTGWSTTPFPPVKRSEEHTSELQSHSELVCRLLLEKKNHQSLERPEQSPFFWQDQVAVTDRSVGNTGKIERRIGVWQTVLPPEKQRPDGDLKEVNDNQEPRDAN